MAQSSSRMRQKLGQVCRRLWSSRGQQQQQLVSQEMRRRESALCDYSQRQQQLVHGASFKSRALKEILNRLRLAGENSETARLCRSDALIQQLARRTAAPGCPKSMPQSSSFAPSSRILHSIPRQGLQQRRFYYADKQGVLHFKRRGPLVWIEGAGPGGSSQRQQRILIILGVIGAGWAYIYFTHLEVVPYTHRRHLVLISPAMEQALGEQEFANVKAQFRSDILPPIHPLSVRVRRIVKEVIESAMAGTGARGQIEHSDVPLAVEPHTHVDRSRAGRDPFESYGTQKDLYGDEKLDDDMWVEKSRKKGLEEGLEGYTKHLENLKWEVIVVDKDIMNAFCLPGGKIVVFTGLLKLFRSDPEIATVLGHEVGHVVARHVAEKLTQGIWLGFLQLVILSFFYVPALIANTSDLLIRLPFSRRMELEADHIGLLLMAAAGFDPRLAPAFYEKMGALEKTPEYLQYASTHPSGKKRAESLRKSRTMELAVQIYMERIAGQGHYRFL